MRRIGRLGGFLECTNSCILYAIYHNDEGFL